jgi:outer membrane lipoprotein SlyB
VGTIVGDAVGAGDGACVGVGVGAGVGVIVGAGVGALVHSALIHWLQKFAIEGFDRKLRQHGEQVQPWEEVESQLKSG